MSRLDEIRAMVAEPGFDPVDLVVADIAYLLRFTDPERLARIFREDRWMLVDIDKMKAAGGFSEPDPDWADAEAIVILAALEAQDD